MMRKCTRCERRFVPTDLVREESRHMEAERKTAGLTGVRFLYYHCPECEMNDIFVDILPRPDESQDDFEQRRGELETIVGQLHPDRAVVVEVVVVPVARP